MHPRDLVISSLHLYSYTSASPGCSVPRPTPVPDRLCGIGSFRRQTNLARTRLTESREYRKRHVKRRAWRRRRCGTIRTVMCCWVFFFPLDLLFLPTKYDSVSSPFFRTMAPSTGAPSTFMSSSCGTPATWTV
ncbi:hypothetical protein M378DRAFT_550605 [Amanita muscaria Koide BX008]|uniref:Uncharacterized protein n=1 Tax=Amanita muscaria (strain Koide BX008) TaxID=946122 RepID=A0A0C2W4B8_AMAMK|nr:hypothetical protein M378DRAFT_550605 [Amanita muscaria Koide BX008]